MAPLMDRRSLVLSLLQVLLLSSMAVALEFRIGGEKGWHVPTDSDSETYNEWARRNRFHIGDSLYFKYKNDSVMVVDYMSYSECNTTKKALQFHDGNTTFDLDRHGFFFFISGKPGHCVAGQKLVVRVMAHNLTSSPAPAPEMIPGDGNGNLPGDRPMRGSSPKLAIGFLSLLFAVVVASMLV